MKMRSIVLCCCLALAGLGLSPGAYAADTSTMQRLEQKTFPTFAVPAGVDVYGVSFDNQYGMRLAGYLFMPAKLQGRAQAIVIGHPMGASKEQAACVYAAQLAGRGFVTLAIDQQFWGGERRHAAPCHRAGFVRRSVQRRGGFFGHKGLC